MATPTKFRALGAVITKVVSDDVCMVAAMLEVSQPLDLADETRWIKVEMRKTPITEKAWEKVRFDDRGIDKNGMAAGTVLSPSSLNVAGITSVGPIKDLPRAQYFGGVYVRDEVFAKLADKIKDPMLDVGRPEYPWQPKGFFVFELTSVAVEGDPRRYHGFYGEVQTVAAGVATIIFFSPYDRTVKLGTFDVKLSDPDQCLLGVPGDPIDPADPTKLEPMIDGVAVLKGGIYIKLQLAATENLRGPKIPIGMGT